MSALRRFLNQNHHQCGDNEDCGEKSSNFFMGSPLGYRFIVYQQLSFSFRKRSPVKTDMRNLSRFKSRCRIVAQNLPVVLRKNRLTFQPLKKLLKIISTGEVGVIPALSRN
jgi:hypothetical protein